MASTGGSQQGSMTPVRPAAAEGDLSGEPTPPGVGGVEEGMLAKPSPPDAPEAERHLTRIERLFGENVSSGKVIAGSVLLLTGFVVSFLRVASHWSGLTLAVPVFQVIGVVLVSVGFALLPSPPMRWQRWATGLVKVACLFGAVLNAAICAVMFFLLPVAASLGPERWASFAEALAAVRWSTVIVVSWVLFFGCQPLFRYGRRWLNLGWPTEDSENMNADLIIARDPDTAREVRIAESDRYMHMLIVGPTGSGKTASGLSPAVIQDIRNPNIGLSILEPKGDWVNGDEGRPGIRQWAEYYGRKVFHIDPADPHTDVFNPLIGDRHMAAEVNSVALRVLFGREVNFFTTAQDALLKKTIYLLKWLNGDNLTYWDLHQAVHNFYLLVSLASELEKRLMHWEEHGFPPNLTADDIMEAKDLVSWFQQETVGKRGEKLLEVTLGLRVQLDNLMNNIYLRRCIIPPPEPFRDAEGNIIGGRTIDLDRHLAMGSILTVSTNDGLLAELSKVLGRMVITAFQFAASRRFLLPLDQRPPHFIWIDEAATYLTPSWGEFQTKARGFRVGINLAIQNLAQLETVQRGFADVIVGQCRNRLIYGGLPPDDIKFWTAAFGTKDVEDVSYTESQRAMPVHYAPGEWIPLGPMSYNLVSSGRSKRIVEKTKLSINEVLEQPRGRAVFQGVVGGNWQPPQIVAVDVVRQMPPKLRRAGGAPVYDPNEGVAVPSGPLLPPIPGAVLAGTVTETVREKAKRPARAQQAAGPGASLAGRVGLLPGQLQAPPEPERLATPAPSEEPLMSPPPVGKEGDAEALDLPVEDEPVDAQVPDGGADETHDGMVDSDRETAEEAGDSAEELAPPDPAARLAAPPPPPLPGPQARIAEDVRAAERTAAAPRMESAPLQAPPSMGQVPPAPPAPPAQPPQAPAPATAAPERREPDVVIEYGRSGSSSSGSDDGVAPEAARKRRQQVLDVAGGPGQEGAPARQQRARRPNKPPAPPAPRMEDIKVQPTFHGLERAQAVREEKKRPRYREEPWE